MKEMPISLFTFIQTYIKFFSSPETQLAVWNNNRVENEDTCHEWIVNFLYTWRSVRNNLSQEMLIDEIDNLHEKLTAYLKKIPKFQEKKVRELHMKILRDYEWLVIQDNSKMIFQQARKLLD